MAETLIQRLVTRLDSPADLAVKAYEIRRDVILSLNAAGSGHLGGSLGSADIFTALYFHVMRHDPSRPSWPDRDRFILSAGHLAPVFYASLAHAGYFPLSELTTLRQLGSRLQGHPGRDFGLPGLELSAGSLGQGLSVAAGMALGGKIDNKDWFVYCLLGDGELQEGSVWEAAMSASHHKLDKLIAIIDRNGLQIDGETREVMELEPLAGKWAAFGWHVIVVDGHDFSSLLAGFRETPQPGHKPAVIIARTLMGKGVRSIENEFSWHGKAPDDDHARQFLTELDYQYSLSQGKGAKP